MSDSLIYLLLMFGAAAGGTPAPPAQPNVARAAPSNDAAACRNGAAAAKAGRQAGQCAAEAKNGNAVALQSPVGVPGRPR